MASGSSGAGNVSPSPASILLAKEAHIAFSRNNTTARAKRLGGNSTVEVTFWTADPPDVSFYTLYCKPSMAIPDADLEIQSWVTPIPVCKGGDVCIHPYVVGAEGRFVLLSALFGGNCRYEYFMYKGDPKSPSLESLPLPDDDYSLRRAEFAIVPRGDDDHYLLIALRRVLKMNNYRLHIYSSEDATWTTKELPNPCPQILIIPDKVFVIRDGLLLWVDLLRGILVCDVLREPLHAEYIPLPEPLPKNRERVKQFRLGVRRFRDLTCVNGLIKFIEMEHREIEREIPDDVPPEKPVDPRTNDVLYDSDLITLVNDKPMKPKTRIEVSVDGWSAMTWTRNIGSNCWRKGRIVDVHDILVDDSVFSALLSIEKSESAWRLTFKNLSSAWPTLSTDGNDILYLKSTSTSGGGALVAVDLAEKKALKVEARRSHPFGKYLYSSPWQILHPCALANHLKMTPVFVGIETSASQIALMGSSANEPNNTAIHVGETDSYESENKRPRHLIASTTGMEPATMGIHSNTLLANHMPMFPLIRQRQLPSAVIASPPYSEVWASCGKA
ncbi:uncharacterized protein [Miscanthus floridulus]|uniref:uncharacterized protein isoform X1 n=1 Tax=Miscanthus floridulus TaxID=154761 RepID=UPI00345AD844